MNYEKLYNSLIESRKRLNRKKIKDGEYFELHHILPKSLGGTNDKDNLILLTAKEHFIAHLLLWKYTDTHEMQYAMFLMTHTATYKNKITSRTYSILREQYSKLHRGKTLSEEHKAKIGKSVTGEKNGFYGKTHTEETKKKLANASKAQKCTEETKKKLSIAHTGKKNGFYGKTHTEENKKKCAVNTGKPTWGKKLYCFDKVMNIKQVADKNNMQCKDIIEILWLLN